jgi:hypothetical protein
MGYGDTDLYDRFLAAGYAMRSFVPATLFHKDHPKDLTIDSQIRQDNGNSIKIWNYMNRFNEILARELPWGQESSKIRWDLEQLEQRRWLATRDASAHS